MSVQKGRLRSVAQAVDTFVNQSGVGAMLSTSDGVLAVRYELPECEHTDGELAELIAIMAISRFRNVVFDQAGTNGSRGSMAAA